MRMTVLIVAIRKDDRKEGLSVVELSDGESVFAAWTDRVIGQELLFRKAVADIQIRRGRGGGYFFWLRSLEPVKQ